MAAFQFPDTSTGETTVVNPITGSTYQWTEPPGKWVVSVKLREVSDIIWEGDTPPDPVGEYKLWYSTDTLELYFYYTDSVGTSAWLPTSKPITLLEELDKNLASVQLELAQTNAAVNENTNRIASIVYFGEEAPTIFADEDLGEVDSDGNPVLEQSELNYKFWLNTTDNQLHILRIDTEAPNGYSYAEVSSNPDLQEVCENGNTTDIPIAVQTATGVSVLEDQALRIQHTSNPYIRLVDENDMDSLEITLNDDHAHVELSIKTTSCISSLPVRKKSQSKEKVMLSSKARSKFSLVRS